MKALSIKQPWAACIVNGWKDIENRDWSTKHRGTIAIHASKVMSKGDLEAFEIATGDVISTDQWAELRRRIDNGTLPFGAIVGLAEIVDCVTESDSPWFFGKYGFSLGKVHALATPIPCTGRLGLWEVPAYLMNEIQKGLAGEFVERVAVLAEQRGWKVPVK